MAVRADRNKIFRRVNPIVGTKFGNRHNMVDVNEIASDLTIPVIESKATDLALRALNGNAECTVQPACVHIG